MGKLNKNQSGLGTVEIILILVIVGILGTVGWFVYDRNHIKTSSGSANSTNTITATSKPDATPKIQTDSTKYLVVKQWGVKIPLSSNVKGLNYKIGNNDANQGTTGSFRSDALDAAGTLMNCETNSIIIVRGLSTQFVPDEINSNETTYKEAYDTAKKDHSDTFPNLKIGDYYYVRPGYRGASCIDKSDDKLLAKEAAAMDAIQNAIAKMVAE